MMNDMHLVKPPSSRLESLKSQEALPPYTLKWRQKILLVKRSQTGQILRQLAPCDQQWLTDCLARSPVQKISLSGKFGKREILIWAKAGWHAKKPVFLRMPSHLKTLRRQRSPLIPNGSFDRAFGQLKRIIDRGLAVVLLLGFTPALLTLALLVKGCFPHSSILVYQWGLGQEGRLFRLYQFRTTGADPNQRENSPGLTGFGEWLQQFHLNALPQLFNVVRGEIGLMEPKHWLLLSEILENWW